jgi:competence protein ComEC
VTMSWGKINGAIAGTLGAQREALLLWIPVFLGLGSALYFGLDAEPSFAITGGGISSSLTLWVAMFWRFRRRDEPEKWFLPFLLASTLFWTVLGFSAAQLGTYLVKAPILAHETRPVLLEGTVIHREAKEDAKGWLFILDDVAIEKWRPDETPQKVRLTFRTKIEADLGERIRVLAKLHPPSAPVMPMAFDFQRFYFFQGIGALGFSLGEAKILPRPEEEKHFFLERLRTKISEEINRKLPESVAGIVSALMTGERAAIAEEDWQALRFSGLAHIISISGLHVAMVATPFFFLVRLFLSTIPYIALRWPIKKIAALVALLACLLYVALVVPSVPTYRAMLMTGIALLAIMLDRSPFSMRMVAFAAGVVLLVFPESIWSASFQMSFGAVIALVAAADFMRPYWLEWNRKSGIFRRIILYVVGAVSTTLVASLATAPFSAYHFQQVAVYSVLANGLAIPLSSLIIMPMLILSFLLMPFGYADWPLRIMGEGVEWMLMIARGVASLPGAVLNLPAIPFSSLVLFSVAALIAFLFEGRLRRGAVLPLVLALILAGVSSFRDNPDFIVSSEANLVLVRSGDEVALSSARTGKFEAETWLRRLGYGQDFKPLYFPREGQLKIGEAVLVSCDGEACRIETGGKKIVFGKSPYALAADCAWADLVVTPIYFDSPSCSPEKVYNLRRLKKTGALALVRGKITTVEEGRGHRPWTDSSWP